MPSELHIISDTIPPDLELQSTIPTSMKFEGNEGSLIEDNLILSSTLDSSEI